jgi:7,8-dihydropterin-6-yl-methyl-4-(beta-D-ribofuranosyl)aminobenzene 5'-phosphate synthase
VDEARAGQRRAPCRITVLCDNDSDDTAGGPSCGCEWGLALAIDLGAEGLWLWDTGQTDLFLQNARNLALDLGQARGLALSHGHFDHTGGLSALFSATTFRGPVHAHPACAQPRFVTEKGRTKPIGPPHPLPEFIPAGPMTPLAPGLTLITEIPRRSGNFQAVQGFSLDPAGTRPDPVPDDAFLVLDSQYGAVVILGCCHSGLANSFSCLRERLGIDRVHAVLGGLHLFKAPPEALEETAQAIEVFGVRRLIAGHCTGPDRLARLKKRLPGREVLPLAAGQSWAF